MTSRILLRSDDSSQYYPNNKGNAFTVKTPNLSNFGHNLEVALTEIVIPSDFINVREGYNAIDLSFTIYDGEIRAERIVYKRYQIDADFYTPRLLIDEINRAINLDLWTEMKRSIFKIAYKESTKQTWMRSTSENVRIQFGWDIAKILGFNSNEWILLSPEMLFCQHGSRAYRHMTSLNVYCSIVEENLVGEFQHQLLRMVNWNFVHRNTGRNIDNDSDNFNNNNDNNNNDNITIVYDRPFFIPVKRAANLDSIEIRILDYANIPVDFKGTDEPVIMILEFRKPAVSST